MNPKADEACACVPIAQEADQYMSVRDAGDRL